MAPERRDHASLAGTESRENVGRHRNSGAEALAFLDGLDDRPARLSGGEDALRQLYGSLPGKGDGAIASLQRLIENGMDVAVGSAGPRCFHFVIGGMTPAALGAMLLVHRHSLRVTAAPRGGRTLRENASLRVDTVESAARYRPLHHHECRRFPSSFCNPTCR